MLSVKRELEAKVALLKVAGVGPKRFEVLRAHFGSAPTWPTMDLTLSVDWLRALTLRHTKARFMQTTQL